MSGGRLSEALSIAALALEIHRQPARHAELLRGFAPLPPGVAVLLRMAGGTALEELDPRLASLAPEGELRRAALFFIEQVLFQREASNYRVLGLNPDATHEQIKEHHRLLMRLFHPDRETRLDGHREQFATRANLAYNTLRDAGARADYDTTLKLQAVHGVQPPTRTLRRAQALVWRRRPEPESFWTVRVYPLLMRYLPQWVLAGTALVSVSVVGVVYLFNPPVHLPQPSVSSTAAADTGKSGLTGENPEAVVQMAAADTSRLDAVVDQFERKIAAAGEMLSAPAPVAQEAVQAQPGRVPAKTDAVAAAPGPLPAQRVHARPSPAASDNAALKPAMIAVAAPAVAAQPVARETLRYSAPPAPAAEPAHPVVAAAVVLAPAAEAPPPTLPDPSMLLSRFLEAYERGDVQTCMSLLDEGLRADAGGKPELRREYDALFRSTDLRHVKILNMNWSRDGEFIRGEGRYRATFMRKGETVLRTLDGQVRVELVRRGGTALINELYYLASGRS